MNAEPFQRSLAGYALFLGIVLLLVHPVGLYLARVFSGETKFLRPLERSIYRASGVKPGEDQSWADYARSFILFSLVGTLALYAVLRLQALLPTYPHPAPATPMTPDLAANTAVSFATTTTWQAYGGETTMSSLAQMLGLCAQNFLAGAAGLAIGIAFVRGFARERKGGLGSFWVDLTRGLLYVLLPLSLIVSVAYVACGVPMTWTGSLAATGLEGASQTIAMGPVAALEGIKNLGTNGGGFFNVNAAHPFETPNNAANLLSMLAIAVLPAALTRTFGIMTGRRRHGWILLGAMAFLFVGGIAVAHLAETAGNPAVTALHVAGGNLEGKETRFGTAGSVLAAMVTSNGATGSYNAMHDSLMPLAGGVALLNMLLGEITFGGLGTGIYSLVLVALLAVFLCGLMVGRTPEYLGKRIGGNEIKLVVLYTLACPMVVLALTALAVVTGPGLAGLTTNAGPHAYTEILYAYASAFTNNGQNFAGLSANSPFYNLTTLVAMMAGRFALSIPALALAGHFAAQRNRPANAGTLPTDGLTFGAILVATALLVGGLSFFPALALGPLADHFAR